MDLEDIIKKVQNLHPDFSEEDIIEVCEEYLSHIPKKIKDSSKLKSLTKYIEKEFGLINIKSDNNENNGNTKKQSLDSMPKSFFATNKNLNCDYLIKVDGLWKSLGKTDLFEDVSFKINSKDKVALIGRNGTGKSTLLKILIGVEELDEGQLDKAKDIKIGYLSQDLFWNSRKNTLKQEMLTVFPGITKEIEELEELKVSGKDPLKEQELNEKLVDKEGFRKYDMQTNILEYFGFKQDHMAMRISQLSGGEQTKVQIAKFLIKEVDILILDEPTNHLDIEGIMFLEKFCKLWPKALLCISHDKNFLDNVFEKIYEISCKKINIYNGNYDHYLKEKQKKYGVNMKLYNDQQKYLEQQNKFIERFRYKASKAAQVQSRIKMLDKIDLLELPEDDLTIRDINLDIDIRIPNMLIEMEQLHVGYNDLLVELPRTVSVEKDEKIGIIGKNGKGKTTLLKTILGEIETMNGKVRINHRIKIGSYSQINEELNLDNTIVDELTIGGLSQTDVRTLLGGLLIAGEKVDQKIGTLSGGEKAKVALTKMLLEKPHIIIMDEPTNHLDIYSKDAIKKMLQQFSGPILIVSHDRDLLRGISNKLWVIKDKKLTEFVDLERGFAEIY